MSGIPVLLKNSVTVDISESPQAQPMSLVMAHKENENDAKNPVHTVPLNLSLEENSIDQKLDELNKELDQKLDKLNRELDLKQTKKTESGI